MIKRIIHFSIKQKLLVGLLVLGWIGWGTYSLTKLTVDAVPDITSNQVQIYTLVPNLATQEVEQLITYPLETSMLNIPGTDEIRSTTKFGLSVITVVFEENVDLYLARQLVNERIKDASSDLPAGANPRMAPITTGLGEVYQYILKPKKGYEDEYNLNELRTIQDWQVKRQLAGIKGVAEISSYGGFVKEYEIEIDPERLNAFNLKIAEVLTALENNNNNTGSAYIEKNSRAYFIRGVGKVQDLEDIRNIVVTKRKNQPILVSDVAKVHISHAPRYGAMTYNGKGETVGGIVLMLKHANAMQVVKDVETRMEDIEKSLPQGLTIEPFYNRATLIGKTINTVEKNLLEGAIIVIAVLIIFLGNWRAGIIVASIIPLSMIFAFGMMHAFGVSANLMSLGAIDFGLIVDGAVIIVEAVMFYLVSSEYYKSALNREQLDEITEKASSKMMSSAVFGQVIILIVYLPILTFTGIEGKMFRPMALTVGFAIIGAIILSLTYVPMISSLLLRKPTNPDKNLSERMTNFLRKIYRKFLLKALQFRWAVIGGAVALLVGTFFLFQVLGGVFLPQLDEGDIVLDFRLQPGSALTESIEATNKAQQLLLENFPEVKHTVARIGVPEVPTDPMPMEQVDLFIILKNKSEWTSAETKEELIEKIDETLSQIPHISYSFTQPIQMRFNEMISGDRSDVAVKLFGEDMSILAQKGSVAVELVNDVPGVADIKLERVEGLPMIEINYNRDQLANYGIDVNTLNDIVQTSVAGFDAGTVYEGDKRFSVKARLKKEHLDDMDYIRSISIPAGNGNYVPLGQLADVQIKSGPMQVSRENSHRKLSIGINVRGRDVESVVEDMKQILTSDLNLPPGYFIEYGGEYQHLKIAMNRLKITVPIVIAIIFIILYFSFGSIWYALMVLTAIPFAAIGGVVTLYLRDLPFSISAGVGFIALFGIAVLNGIVLINYYIDLQKEGVNDLSRRIMKGSLDRLRPVLMTALVASLGFLPMALNTSTGSEVQRPLASVVIGGLLTSTLLTLFVLPVIYYLIERFLDKNVRNKSVNLNLGILLPLFLVLSPGLFAQQTNPQKLVNANEAMEMATANHPSVKMQQSRFNERDALVGTAWDLPNLNANYQQEEIGDVGVPGLTGIYITQQFQFPTTYSAKRQMLKADAENAQLGVSATKRSLRYRVLSKYYQLQVMYERQALYQRMSTVYRDFVDKAKLQYETGNIGKVEQLVANSGYEAFAAEREAFRSDLDGQLVNFNELLRASEMMMPDTAGPYRFQLEKEPGQLAGFWDSLYRQPLVVQQYQQKLTRQSLIPNINAGYLVQGYDGGSLNLWGFTAGLTIPIDLWTSSSEIKAANHATQAASFEYQMKLTQLERQLLRLKTQLDKYASIIEKYEQESLPVARNIVRTSRQNLEAGNIAINDHLINLQQAMKLEQQYLDLVRRYNEIAIQIHFLINE